MDEKSLTYALKLLARREYTRYELGRRLERRFGPQSADILDWLTEKGYLDDRRFGTIFIEGHPEWGRHRVDAELERRGVAESVRRSLTDETAWPSIRDVMKDRMTRKGLESPLTHEEAARMARTLARLGHDPLEIQEELERLL